MVTPVSGGRSIMATRDPDPDQGDDFAERIEHGLYGRRRFLAGLAAGGAGGTGVALGIGRLSDGAGFQPRATLAGGVAGPSRTRYYLPAVDSAGEGLIVTADLEIQDGTGDVFVNLDGIEVRHDLQFALREASRLAAKRAGTSPDALDTYVSFSAPDNGIIALGGKSWEAGLVVGIVAAIRGVVPGRETLVTGVVANDGSLLPVGGIETKARAAREFGATRLLVPDGQEQRVPGIVVEGIRTIDRMSNAVLTE